MDARAVRRAREPNYPAGVSHQICTKVEMLLKFLYSTFNISTYPGNKSNSDLLAPKNRCRKKIVVPSGHSTNVRACRSVLSNP